MHEKVGLCEKNIYLIGYYIAVNCSQMDLMNAWFMKRLLHGIEHFALNAEVKGIKRPHPHYAWAHGEMQI